MYDLTRGIGKLNDLPEQILTGNTVKSEAKDVIEYYDLYNFCILSLYSKIGVRNGKC